MSITEATKLMRREQETLRRLIDRLRRETALVPRTGLRAWVARVGECFEHFRAHFVKQMATEEGKGHLAPAVERHPALADEVARLRHEHAEFISIMDGIHEAAERIAEDDHLLARDLCARVERLLYYVDGHEAAENLLLLEGVNRDLGTKD